MLRSHKEKRQKTGSEAAPNPLTKVQLKAMAEKDPLPKARWICRDYNKGQCRARNCIHPHVCFKYFDPDTRCNDGTSCTLNHNVFDPQVRNALQNAGFNVNKKPGELRNDYVNSLRRRKRQAAQKPKASSFPKVCLNFNGGCCSNRDCRLLHICHDYIQRKCQIDHNECPYSHNMMKIDVKKRLEEAGFDVDRKPGEIIRDYRKALEREGNKRMPEGNRLPVVDLTDGKFVKRKQNQRRPNPRQMKPKPQTQGRPGSQTSSVVDSDEGSSNSGISSDNEPMEAVPAAIRPNRMGNKSKSVVNMSSQVPNFTKGNRKKRASSAERRHGSEVSSLVSSDDCASGSDENVFSNQAKGEKEQKKKKQRNRRGKPKANVTQQQQQRQSPQQNIPYPSSVLRDHSGYLSNLMLDSLTLQPKTQPFPTARAIECRVSSVADAIICSRFIWGECYHPDCIDHHQGMPYLWQYRILKDTWTWEVFNSDSNMLLEQSFCSVQTNACSVIIQGNMFSVEFEKMLAKYAEMTIPVRRLSTVSWAEAGEETECSTKWTWYWDSDEGWIPCGQKNKDTSPEEVTRVQRSLETGYLENPSGKITVKMFGDRWVFDFTEMRQILPSSGTTRQLRRRPVFFSQADKEKIQSIHRRKNRQPSEVISHMSLPPEWKKMGPEDGEVIFSDVPKQSREFESLNLRFQLTLPDAEIVVVKRIQNPSLWMALSLKKSKLTREYGSANINEMNLFHGTKADCVNSICSQNFDWRLYGAATGTRYGKGVYFAMHANKANSYVSPDENGLRYIFSARVLLGRISKGEKSMRRPPAISPDEPTKLYDSCADDPTKPSIFVVFDKDQYYPEFIICYKMK